MLSRESAVRVINEIINLYPNVETVLNYSNEFELLIAVILSAQTTDIAVNKVTELLFADYPTPDALAQATPAEIEQYLKSIGLYRNKSTYIIKCAQDIVERFAGQVPANRRDLQSLAGVGRKTANVILSVAFNIPAFAVDTHVTRVCKHHKIVPEFATTRQIEDYVVSIMPSEQLTQAHQSIIFFGREICHPRNPECHHYPQLYEDLTYIDDDQFLNLF